MLPCLFVGLSFLCGSAATTFYIFCTFSNYFPVQGKQFMQQYSEPCLQPSDVKTPKLVIDASMPKVMYIV